MRNRFYLATRGGEELRNTRLTVLALAGSMMAAICLCGATAYTVSQHPFEFDLSIALGPHSSQVLTIDLRHESPVRMQ